MKKLSKKQKLIGFIAILLVAVILAIAITTSIIKNNNQVANEGYAATSANAGSSLISNYILNGITIGGITGKMDVLNTLDATAKPEDIAKGKTAYVNGVKITGIREPSLSEINGNETENTETKDKYGNKIVIPAGFKVVNPNVDVTKGIIIEDVSAGDSNTKGSQFVWIPVGDIYTSAEHTEENKVTITLGRYSFASDGTPSPYSGSYTEDTAESHNSSYGNVIAKDINDFIEKANSSNGYYLGRYELGDATATTSQHTSYGTSNPITCKAGVYPYNYITQSQASSLCRGMYSSSSFESDLINSYAWDTAIVFIQEFSGDTDYSMQVGRNTARAVRKCGESILDYNLDEGDLAQDVRCNIYDMAGNTYEWSTETYSNTVLHCVPRGGYYDSSLGYTKDRYSRDTAFSGSVCSARPTLYL